MSSKPIELQIAIPRTSEIGQAQLHLMHKPQHDQALLAAKLMEQQARERKKSTKVEQPSGQIHEHPDDGLGGRPQPSQEKEAGGKTATKSQAVHPYKGRHIDLSL